MFTQWGSMKTTDHTQHREPLVNNVCLETDDAQVSSVADWLLFWDPPQYSRRLCRFLLSEGAQQV